MEPTETMRTIVDQYEDYNYKVSLSLTSHMLCIDQEFFGNMIGIFFFINSYIWTSMIAVIL